VNVLYLYSYSKLDPEAIGKIRTHMETLLNDETPLVQKTAIQVVAKLYRTALVWISRSTPVTQAMTCAWKTVNDLKRLLLLKIENHNAG